MIWPPMIGSEQTGTNRVILACGDGEFKQGNHVPPFYSLPESTICRPVRNVSTRAPLRPLRRVTAPCGQVPRTVLCVSAYAFVAAVVSSVRAWQMMTSRGDAHSASCFVFELALP